MKRFNNLYEQIYDIENIKVAHENARKGKSSYREVILVNENPDFYISKIHEMLKNKKFINSKYRTFIKVDKGKTREIFSLPYFPDRIVHHCIMQVLEPIWFKTLIRDTYSSIKNRGIHDGVGRLKSALNDKENTKYCLQMDIRKFYPSVDNEIMKQIIRRKIKCKDTLELLDLIIDSTKGIPIGNYLSQYFGNIYLSGLDHFIKENCRMKYYFRYCDDMVILHSNKEELHSLINKVSDYITSNLKLELKSNYQIYPVDIRGIDFLGYKFYHNLTILRKSICNNFKRRIRNIKHDTNYPTWLMSYYGWIKHCDGNILWKTHVNCKFKNTLLKLYGNKNFNLWNK